MSGPTQPAWAEANQRYLAASLQRLRVLLEGGSAPEPDPSDWVSDSPPALVGMSELFGLSPFERDLLLLTAGVELDGDLAELWGPNVAANDIAARSGTIGYELLTGVTRRVPRVYE